MRALPALWCLALAGCVTPPNMQTLLVRPVSSPTHASLRGVSAVSAQVVWTSGSDGTCLRSLDGGATWAACGPEQARGRDLRDVHAVDALHAVVMAVGSPALLLSTADGGATWREVWRDERPEAFLDGMAFSPSGTGFAFGDPVHGEFAALRSRDDGATWEPVAGVPSPLAGEAAFAASGTCVAVLSDETFLAGTGGGEVARVLRGADAGSRWSVAFPPVSAGSASRGVFSLAASGARVVAVGGDYQRPDDVVAVIALSDDGGRTWRPPTGAPPRGYRSAVAFVPGCDGRVVVAVGSNGVDVSHDGGESFAAAGDDGYHALAFAADGTGYAVGADGRIARLGLGSTTDRTR